MEEQKGFWARQSSRFHKWQENRKQLWEETVREQAVRLTGKARLETKDKSQTTLKDFFSVPKKIIGNVSRPKRKWFSFDDSRKSNLLRSLDKQIRQATRGETYLNLSNDEYEDAAIFVREEMAIEDTFERNWETLLKYYSPAEAVHIKETFIARAREYDEVRRMGLDVRPGKIAHLREAEVRFGYVCPQSLNYLKELEIEIRAKQKVRGMDRRIAEGAKLEIKEAKAVEASQKPNFYSIKAPEFAQRSLQDYIGTSATPKVSERTEIPHGERGI